MLAQRRPNHRPKDNAHALVGETLSRNDLLVRRNRLLWRIHRRYVTTTLEVQFGNLNFPFTRIADPDRVLDEVAEEADLRERLSGRREEDEHLHLPYWAELWDSAFGLGQLLAGQKSADKETRRQGDKHKNQQSATSNQQLHFSPPPPPPLPVSPSSWRRVLDLGCGMGLAGTVAAALGANVTFADIEPAALLFAQLNSLPWRQCARFRKLNWRTDAISEKFNLILGADILYERSQWEFLDPFWRGHLAKGGQVWLGEPGRQTGDMFIEWIKSREWELAIDQEFVPTRLAPIRILVIRPTSDAKENLPPVHPEADQP